MEDDFEIVRGALNMSINLKRDGFLLRSATESSIFERRRKKRELESESANPEHIPFAIDM